MLIWFTKGMASCLSLAALVCLSLVSPGNARAALDACPAPAWVNQRLLAVCAQTGHPLKAGPGKGPDLAMVMRLARQRENPRVRYCAVYSLGEIGDPRATNVLLDLLGHPSPHLRRMAAHSLGKIRDPRAVVPLIELLCRPQEDMAVQCAAAAALGKLGDPRAQRILAYLTRHPCVWMQREAIRALAQMTPVREPQKAQQ